MTTALKARHISSVCQDKEEKKKAAWGSEKGRQLLGHVGLVKLQPFNSNRTTQKSLQLQGGWKKTTGIQ